MTKKSRRDVGEATVTFLWNTRWQCLHSRNEESLIKQLNRCGSTKRKRNEKGWTKVSAIKEQRNEGAAKLLGKKLRESRRHGNDHGKSRPELRRFFSLLRIRRTDARPGAEGKRTRKVQFRFTNSTLLTFFNFHISISLSFSANKTKFTLRKVHILRA